MKDLPPLPIDDLLPELRQRLTASPNLILVAEPGAGKTTRVPLALIDAPWRRQGRILVLEPRRLAARAAAEQMSRLLGEEVGARVGYRVRMESKVSADTVIEVVTEGVLTRMLIEDQSLPGVAAILFDEFHERSLDGDLGLALALDAQSALREELRLIVMSATLDDEAIARLLNGAPVLRSHGRSFPVETRYRPRQPQQRIEEAMTTAVLALLASEDGSILAFLPGAGEIEAVRRRILEERLPAGIDVVPLYGALDAKTQRAAIRPADPGKRKIVLATSIAETSLTIEGVRIVVDSGLARVPRYDPASGLTRLETERAARASVDQRRGRAGRTAPGICVRLWQEAETRALPAFAMPEIRQADLASLLIDCAACGVMKPETLRFLDPPPPAALGTARGLLRELDAIDEGGRLTSQGKKLSRLPLPPRLAHMLAEAPGEGRLLAAFLAAILSERGAGGDDIDVGERLRRFRRERGERADRARAMAQRWARLAGAKSEELDEALAEKAGRVLALAFPDRIAQRRPERPGEFVLANGRGVGLDPALPLAKQEFLAVAEITGSEQRGRILSAAALSRADIEAVLSSRIERQEELAFDRSARAVRARKLTRLGRIILSESPLPARGEAVTGLLLSSLAELGLEVLPWTPATRQYLDRARFLRAADAAGWPDLGAEALTTGLADWLGPYVPGVSRLADIGSAQLQAALLGLMQGRAHEIDREAPAFFEAPTGSRIPIDYDIERGPVVAVRVQELFGLGQHPRLAAGRIPITFDLLSPAHRPIQTTSDLPGFWKGSWRDVRSDMRGRYPKHVWPDDPATAAATRRAKPRGS